MLEAENERRQSCRQQRQQFEVGDVSLGRYQFERKLHNSRFSQPTIRRNNTLNIDEPEEPKIANSTAGYYLYMDIGYSTHPYQKSTNCFLKQYFLKECF